MMSENGSPQDSDRREPTGNTAVYRSILRCLFVFGAVITLWLFGHFYLTHRHDITPWKLGGMAMYLKAGPRYEINWRQRFDGADHEMRISAQDLEELFERQTSPDKMLSYGNLIGIDSAGQYLMHTREAPYPVVAVVGRKKHSVRRSRFIDRSCRYELAYIDGEMYRNRVCRSIGEAVIRLRE